MSLNITKELKKPIRQDGRDLYAYLVYLKDGRQRVMLAHDLDRAENQAGSWGGVEHVVAIGYGKEGASDDCYLPGGESDLRGGGISRSKADEMAKDIDDRIYAMHEKHGLEYHNPGTVHLACLIRKHMGDTLSIREEEDLNRYLPGTKKLKLNETYEAEVCGDTIKVGCQTFPVSKLRELLELVGDA